MAGDSSWEDAWCLVEGVMEAVMLWEVALQVTWHLLASWPCRYLAALPLKSRRVDAAQLISPKHASNTFRFVGITFEALSAKIKEV